MQLLMVLAVSTSILLVAAASEDKDIWTTTVASTILDERLPSGVPVKHVTIHAQRVFRSAATK